MRNSIWSLVSLSHTQSWKWSFSSLHVNKCVLLIRHSNLWSYARICSNCTESKNKTNVLPFTINSLRKNRLSCLRRILLLEVWISQRLTGFCKLIYPKTCKHISTESAELLDIKLKEMRFSYCLSLRCNSLRNWSFVKSKWRSLVLVLKHSWLCSQSSRKCAQRIMICST